MQYARRTVQQEYDVKYCIYQGITFISNASFLFHHLPYTVL